MRRRLSTLLAATMAIAGCHYSHNPEETVQSTNNRTHLFESRFHPVVNTNTLPLASDATARSNLIANFPTDPQWSQSKTSFDEVDDITFALMFEHTGLLPDANYEVALLSDAELAQARDFHQNQFLETIPTAPAHQVQSTTGGYILNELALGRVPTPANLSDPLPAQISQLSPDYGPDTKRFLVKQGTGYEVILDSLKSFAQKESVDHTGVLSSTPSLTFAAGTAPSGVGLETRLFALEEGRKEAFARRFIPQSMQNNTGQEYQITILREPTQADQLGLEIFAALRKENETSPLSRVYDLDQTLADLSQESSQVYSTFLTSPFSNALSTLRAQFGTPGYTIAKIGFQNIYDVRIQD